MRSPPRQETLNKPTYLFLTITPAILEGAVCSVVAVRHWTLARLPSLLERRGLSRASLLLCLVHLPRLALRSLRCSAHQWEEAPQRGRPEALLFVHICAFVGLSFGGNCVGPTDGTP